ncbi:DUF6303 family protein [Streptomyces parvulus]|uniref:DUF6303 family protein n=1 Tax=Streptomyces parvulus TaxID=146923 RepID=UPI0033CD96C1
MAEAVTWAGFGWSGEHEVWELVLADPETGLTSGLEWDDGAGPPSLMDRYDALAGLGYAVVQGGPEAWQWVEKLDEEGRLHLYATTEIRPLTAEELALQGAPAEG